MSICVFVCNYYKTMRYFVLLILFANKDKQKNKENHKKIPKSFDSGIFCISRVLIPTITKRWNIKITYKPNKSVYAKKAFH